jgi:hypothetical protein
MKSLSLALYGALTMANRLHISQILQATGGELVVMRSVAEI